MLMSIYSTHTHTLRDLFAYTPNCTHAAMKNHIHNHIFACCTRSFCKCSALPSLSLSVIYADVALPDSAIGRQTRHKANPCCSPQIFDRVIAHFLRMCVCVSQFAFITYRSVIHLRLLKPPFPDPPSIYSTLL